MRVSGKKIAETGEGSRDTPIITPTSAHSRMGRACISG
jgi:hypothetical protein